MLFAELRKIMDNAGIGRAFYKIPSDKEWDFYEGYRIDRAGDFFNVSYSEHGNEQMVKAGLTEEQACAVVYNKMRSSWPELASDLPVT